MSVSGCGKLGIFGALIFFIGFFVHTYQIFTLMLVDVD
jgi:hypothetical protein